MKTAYFDCFSGAAGDMIVAALLDAGLDFSALQAELNKLRLAGCTVSAKKVRRAGLAGTKFDVQLPTEADEHEHQHAHEHEHTHERAHEHGQAQGGEHGHTHEHDHDHDRETASEHAHEHRGLKEILALIESAGLRPRAAELAKRIFQRLGEAEAKVHGVDIQEVHFHEVGAYDSIMDIVGCAVAVDLLGIERVICSPIPAGSGLVKMAHGVLPVPAPATAELLKGAAIASPPPADKPTGELTTPTGAAVLTTLAAEYGPLPAMEIESIGYGAGTRDPDGRPNLLRVFLGQSPGPSATVDSVIELSANLDDCSGQVIAAAMEALMAAGALDAWAAPIHMKKSRPAWLLSALCSPADVARMETILFSQTTTLGIRRHTCQRSMLSRRHETVETPYGPVRVKVGLSGEKILTASPEYADAASAAAAHGASLKEVLAAALEAFRRKPQSQD